MVKNNTGGNKSKKSASKSFNTTNKNTRFSSDPAELYAIVNKMIGGNLCEVFCIDGITRLCIIRRKFYGKGRRDNWLSKGKWILVGLRTWETTNNEKNKCDLLEVYSDYDKEKLIKNSNDDFKLFISNINISENIDNDNFEFSSNANNIFESELNNSDHSDDYDHSNHSDNSDHSDNYENSNHSDNSDYSDNSHSSHNNDINNIIKHTYTINIDDI